MGFYQKNKEEIITIQLISQILGKIKLEYAAQEPQWAHVMLDITPRGFSTGLLKNDDSYFEIEVDLMHDYILIRTESEDKKIILEDNKAINSYYEELMFNTKALGLSLKINTKLQEMNTTIHFEEDTEHHHYSNNVAREVHQWFLFGWNSLQEFIASFRQRKVYPGLFLGTFDVACILVYNQSESFPNDTKVIERAAFNEHMIEFGFWLGGDGFEHPTFFTLPYPFVENVELEVDDAFPKGSYFSPEMAEYLFEVTDSVDHANTEDVVQFLEASCKKSLEYLEWENTSHYFKDLKMEKNNSEI